MNPELQAKLVTYLDGLEKGAAKVGEFAEREIPETIREWLLWLAVERFSYAAAFLIAAAVVYFFCRRLLQCVPEWNKQWIKEEKSRYPNIYRDNEPVPDGVETLLIMAIQVALVVLLMIGCFKFALDGVKVIIAPRVVIVEKVSELAKGK